MKHRFFLSFLFACLFVSVTIPLASAVVSSDVTGPDLRVTPMSVQQQAASGVWVTMPLENGRAGNFRVELGKPGLVDFTSELLTYGGNYMTYRHTAVYDVLANALTVSKQEDIVQREEWSQEWLRYRQYEIDTWNNYFDTTPGHPRNFVGGGSIGFYTSAVTWDQFVSNTALFNQGAVCTFTAPRYILKDGQVANYIDHYRDLQLSASITPPRSVTMYGADDSNVTMTYGITDWEVTSAWAGASTTADIGAYNVDFIGYDNNHISLDISYTHTVNQVQMSSDLQATYVATLLSSNGGVEFGYPYRATIQNAQKYAPGAGDVLLASPAGVAEAADLVIPIDIRPQVDYFNQQVTVGRVGKGSPLDIRTKSDFWFAPGAAITGQPSVDPESYDRWVQVYAQNYVIQMHTFLEVTMYSQVQLNGITSEALLGIPEWTQGDIIADLAITGDTGKAMALLSAYGLGSFLTDAQTVTQSILAIAGPILIILGIGIAMYAFVKVGIPMLSHRRKR